MTPNLVWIFYVVLMSPNGSGDVTVGKFSSAADCEHFLHTSYTRVKKEYPLKEHERIVGAGCKRNKENQ